MSVTSTKAKARARRDAANPTKKELYLAEVRLPLYGLDNGAGGFK